MPVHLHMSDPDLLVLLKTGDHAAFTELYNRYWDKLYAVAYHRLGNESEAEEVVQEIFLSLWKRRKELQLKYSLATYLSVSVKYQIINLLAHQQRNHAHLNTLPLSEENGGNYTELWLSEKELRIRLEQCINKLPQKCRLVFELSRNEGKSTKQISQELHIAEKTVEAHITRALGIIRSSLHFFLPFFLFFLNK